MIGSIAAYVRTFTRFERSAWLFLLTTFVFGAVTSLYWVDFNLYLEAIGVDRPTIGWLLAASQVGAVAAALPASALSDRFGRRAVMAGGFLLAALGCAAFLLQARPFVFAGVVAFGIGGQSVFVVQIPFMAEHTKPDHRNEYFSLIFATGFLTQFISALGGGLAATRLADVLGLGGAAGPYQVLLVAMVALSLTALATCMLLARDRPVISADGPRHGRFGIHVQNPGLFVRLLLPGFIMSLGAGQLIPFLNVYVKGKFGLDLAAVNGIFAVTSLGTALAVLLQPVVARRYGKVGSVVLVQAVSIPFLLVLGFSPLLWTVIAAMAVRNSLMNAGGPIFDAFAMERVSVAERATVSAGMSLLWSLGWTIGGPYYSLVQAALGFDAGYAVNFVTIIVLYSASTALLWYWFGERRAVATAEGTAPVAGVAAVAAAEAAGAAPTSAR